MFAQAFRTPDLRKKLLFTLGIIVVYRFGASLPVPGISAANVRFCSGLASQSQGTAANLYAMLNLFSGGSLLHVTVFALSIMPYITSSIIIQLLTEVIPRLQKLKDEGQAGQAKITQYTRYLTLGLAILQSSAFVALARSGQLFQGQCEQWPVIPEGTGLSTTLTLITLVITMTAGTGVVMWLGELITDRGVGNGMSVLIFTSIAARLPNEGWTIKEARGWPTFLAILAVGAVVIALVVFIEQAQRRIPVQFAKRLIGRRVYGGTSRFIRL